MDIASAPRVPGLSIRPIGVPWLDDGRGQKCGNILIVKSDMYLFIFIICD